MKDSNLYFIDTNIFLRVLVKEDKTAFEQCFRILELVKLGKMKSFTCSLVITEVSWVLTKVYKFSKKEVITALKSILNLKNLKIVEQSNMALAVFLYEHHNVKFVDSLISANDLLFKKKAKIISYDKDFDKLDIIRVEPAQLIKMYYKYVL